MSVTDVDVDLTRTKVEVLIATAVTKCTPSTHVASAGVQVTFEPPSHKRRAAVQVRGVPNQTSLSPSQNQVSKRDLARHTVATIDEDSRSLPIIQITRPW